MDDIFEDLFVGNLGNEPTPQKTMYDRPKTPSITRVSLDKVYLKNRDGTERETPKFFNVGTATPHSIRDDSAMIMFSLDVSGDTRFTENLEVVVAEEGLFFLSGKRRISLTLDDLSSMFTE